MLTKIGQCPAYIALNHGDNWITLKYILLLSVHLIFVDCYIAHHRAILRFVGGSPWIFHGDMILVPHI